MGFNSAFKGLMLV